MNLERTERCQYYQKILEKKEFQLLPHRRYESETFNFQMVEAEGFDFPFVVTGTSSNFGLEIPPRSWTLKNVAEAIGGETPVRIIEVCSQSELHGYTIGEYAEYLSINKSNFESHSTARILNMISLEVSNTALSDSIRAPKFVDSIDWVSLYWPLERISRNDYPRVQKYCLAGMAGSYTDFHIDFGGTSVWYHILWGRKRFYVIPPSTENLKTYEDWTCSREQSKTFLGDLLACHCYIVDLIPNETLIIPSGWIHAVLTPEDSLVFGGNFLHSYSIVRQLQSFKIEFRSKVNEIYMFPYFRQINFCFLLHIYESCVATTESNQLIMSNPRILLQLPILLKSCEEWLQDRRFRASFDAFVKEKPQSVKVMINQLWDFLAKMDFMNHNLQDLKNDDESDEWEQVICDKISSNRLIYLLSTAAEKLERNELADSTESDYEDNSTLHNSKKRVQECDRKAESHLVVSAPVKKQRKAKDCNRESLWAICSGKSKRK